MFNFSTDIKWNERSFAVAYYTYILHTRVDVEPDDIVFLYRYVANDYSRYDNDNKFIRYIVDVQENSTFFQMLATIEQKEFKINDLKISSTSLLYTNDRDLKDDIIKSFSVVIKRDENGLTVDFNSSFSYAQQNNFERLFMRVVRSSIEQGDCKLKDYSLLRKNEIEPIINAYNDTKLPYNKNLTVLECFTNSYVFNSHKTCVVYNGKNYSYSDIEKQSNQIANLLAANSIKNKGEGVLLYIDRSEKIISSILAVMKLGCYYLPVDISSPVGRVCEILKDSHIKCILTDNNELENSIEIDSIGCNIVNINRMEAYPGGRPPQRITSKSSDRCYMIYTSGSSGRPKGVSISNSNIANFVSNNILAKKAESISSPCIYSVNKVGFDAFVADTLLALACEFKIVMASSEELDNPHLFIRTIKEQRVNLIQTTPTRINVSILNYSPDTLKRIKVIICGGEPLVTEMISQIRRYAPNSTLINVYGPTETTVWSVTADLSNWEKGIGKPSQNTRCFVLNRYRKIMPHYETGVLHISGDGLGRYPFDQENNEKSFYYIPDIPNDLLYNSHDTAYIDDNYFIHYMSRVDSQVKINGVRIELEELESLAQTHPKIELCAAAVKSIDNMGNRLVFYYKSHSPIDRSVFVDEIFKKLPASHIPNYFVHLTEFPYTLSKKIDRKALPLPKVMTEELVLPRNKMEQIIYDSCREGKPGLSIGVNKPLAEYGFQSTDMPGILTLLNKKSIEIQDFRILNNSFSIEQIAQRVSEGFEFSNGSSRNFPEKFFNDYTDSSKASTYLLTGASGYLGAHILNELISSTNSSIICISHNKKIEESYNYYFRQKDLSDRVKIVKGSLDSECLGLAEDDFELVESADAIINCAAYVKYFGDVNKIQHTNVESVKHLIEFAMQHNITLNHISTLSVLGAYHGQEVDETSFWVGQEEIFSNQYIESKFLAENEIRKRGSEGLRYRIIRIGRLAWRWDDGRFQQNKDDNEFYCTLKAFKTLKMVPIELSDIKLEISPIDNCAKAIALLCEQKYINGIFHVMNHNLISLKDIIYFLNDNGTRIKFVTMEEFMEAFNQIDDSSPIKRVLQMCSVKNDSFIIENNERINNNRTQKLLSECFAWNPLDKSYFSKFNF